MANPYGVPDAGLQTQPNQTDWSFLQSQLYRSNQQEEQGLQKVESGYSSILSAPLTDDANLDKRKEYIAQVQEGLKKVATTDLSLPQNVAQAENLYAPFWQDDYLLKDMSYTKYEQGEMSKLDNWQNSSDKDIRGTYNDSAREYIQRGLLKLKNAGRDPDAYNKLQRREAIPVYDINADVDKAWSQEYEKGQGINSVTTDGAALVTQMNGIKSKDAYKTYYLSKMGDKYEPQLRMLATVEMDRAKDEILRQHPELNEKEVNEHFANEYISQLGTSYKSTSDAYQSQADFWDKKLKDITDQVNNRQKGYMSPEQSANYQYYHNKQSEAAGAAKEYGDTFWKEYSPLTPDNKTNNQYYSNVNDIAEHPQDHISEIKKNQMADIWASGRAAITSEKRELDPVWAKYSDIEAKRIDQQIENRKVQATLRGQTLDYERGTGRDLKGNPLPGFSPDRASGWYGKLDNVGTGLLNPNSGQITGTNTVDVSKLPDGVDVIQDKLNQRASQVAGQIFNPDTDGISGIALKQLGLSKDEIIDVSEGAMSMLDGSHPTQKQSEVLGKLRTMLRQHGIGYDINGPASLQQAIIDYAAHSAAPQLMHSDKQDEVEAGKKLQAGYIVAQTQRDIYLQSQKNLSKAMDDNMLSIPELTTVKNGVRQVMTPDNISNHFPESIQVYDNEKAGYKTISAKDMAKSFLDGNFNYSAGSNEIKIGGQSYKVADVKSYNALEHWYLNHDLEKELGDSEQIGSLRKSASSKAVGGMKEFKNGVIAKELSWDPNASVKGNNNQENFALNIAPELAMPSNTLDVYEDKPGDMDKADKAAIRTMLTNVSDVKNHVGLISHTVNSDNQEVYKIHMQSPDKITTHDSKLDKLAGKTIYLTVSPTATGPLMRSVPENNGGYIYSGLYDGESYNANSLIQGMGVNYHVRGYQTGPDGKATKASVTISQRIKDPDHIGKWIDKPMIEATVPLGSNHPNGKNPDEVMGAVLYTVDASAGQNVVNNNTAHSKVTPQTGIKLSDLQAQLNR